MVTTINRLLFYWPLCLPKIIADLSTADKMLKSPPALNTIHNKTDAWKLYSSPFFNQDSFKRIKLHTFYTVFAHKKEI